MGGASPYQPPNLSRPPETIQCKTITTNNFLERFNGLFYASLLGLPAPEGLISILAVQCILREPCKAILSQLAQQTITVMRRMKGDYRRISKMAAMSDNQVF